MIHTEQLVEMLLNYVPTYPSNGDPTPCLNGADLTIATIIKFIMASAAEAELAALFIAAREMVSHRQTLIDMGWWQP
jgi:hypothetical protein